MTVPARAAVPRRPLPAGTGRAVRQRLARLRLPRPGLLWLCGLSLLLMAGGLWVGIRAVPPSTQVLPLLAGGILLARRDLVRLIVLVAAALACTYAVLGTDGAAPGALLAVTATAAFSYVTARKRDQAGLGGIRSDAVLVELRERLVQQGSLPALPPGWHAEAVVRPAGDGPFSGDFVVSACTGRRFELALVDVSGKGVDAGTRALLLSGALGGLLGSRPEEFLPRANDYLVRQDWDEGFATAVHLLVDLHTGDYVIDSAGHPPVAHFDAGSGRWSLTEADGVVLGLLPDVSYVAARGRLDPGDALVLYTDGLVEIPGRDLSVGIDKLLGEAERLVPHGFAGGADLLVTRVAGTSPDDRGLVLLWRSS